MTTLGELGEFEVIRRLLGIRPAAAAAARADDGVAVGPGDDAAIVRPRPGFEIAITTDAFTDGVHFRREWIGGEALGARLARANLSDLAAMAAEPRWALLSEGVRRDHGVEDLAAIQRGLVDALAAEGAEVVGGNLCAVNGPEWLSLTLLGEVARGAAWTRFGVRPGDLIAVTGFPGRAGAGARLAAAGEAFAREPRGAALIDAWLSPRPRVSLARALAPLGAVTAAIDISDGFAGDLAHLCEASGVGARLEQALWPADAALEQAAALLGTDELELRLGASDDYELVLAVDPSGRGACEAAASAHGASLRVVGAFTEAPGLIEWRADDGSTRTIGPAGWDHFRSEAGED